MRHKGTMKIKPRFVVLALLPILAALLWYSFGPQPILSEARKARTRKDVHNLRLKYPILLSRTPSEVQTNIITGQWDFRFPLFSTRLYKKRHFFTWRFDTSFPNTKVVSYGRMSQTVIFGTAYSEDESLRTD
jgi:hypothetical protein